MRATGRAWAVTNKVSEDAVISPHTSVWRNPNLAYFFNYSDPVTEFGIKKLGDIVGNGKLLQFDTLKAKFHLPKPTCFAICSLDMRIMRNLVTPFLGFK